ncbi:SH3 domain-containing protein [Bacillus sp. V59.32b]|uniref:SH3 domain-containing protein n=1 Tax=Bacillus sp. V59.32b TaxID=1758642 RepID=UPI000E3D9771|nr:SH3 domain-containing protein [Bacillus sp. V59.32b]RFU66834.1 peptide-binding protein [Bacillus sp. V59.32b]
MKNAGKILILSVSLAIGSAAVLSPVGTSQVEASSTVKFSKKSYISTTNVNIRSGPSTKYSKVITVPKGKTVTSGEKRGSWYKVSYTYTSKGKKVSKTGWVSGSYIRTASTSTVKFAKTSYQTTSGLTMRTGASSKNKKVITIPKGKSVTSAEKKGNWYKVSYTYSSKGKNVTKTGWVDRGLKEYYRYSTTKGTNYYTKKQSNLHSTPDTKKKEVYKIPINYKLTSTQKVINSIGQTWYRASYKGKNYYIYAGSVSTKPTITETAIAAKTHLIKAKVSLRKTADSSSSVVGEVPSGKILYPTHKVSNGWYKLSYGGKTGYIAGSSLQEVRTGDPLSSRSGYQFIDLRKKSTVTATQINNYIASYVKSTGKTSILTGKGQVIINAGNKYGVNALYLAAHAIHESAYGTSQISLGKNNLFGFKAYDSSPYISAARFSSVDKNIEYIAQEMKTTYLNPSNWRHKGAYLGFSTKSMSNARIDTRSEGMNFYYASDPYWGKGIAAHMGRIMSYNSSHYTNVSPNTTIPAVPSLPSGSDVFPVDIQAVANKEMKLTNSRGSTAITKSIQKGTKFTLLEKTNDFWVKINVGGMIYWTKSIDFVFYKQYMSVKNLGRSISTSKLSVRQSANTSSTVVGTLYLNNYVHLILKKDGTLTMDSTKTWYQVKLSDGKIGWVSSKYIVRELQ